MKFFLYLLLVFGSLQAMSRGAAPQAGIGVRTLEYEDTERQRPILVEFWYPTSESGPVDEPDDAFWIHPREIRNGAISNGTYPLILLSHGHGGGRRDLSWLAEQLIHSGFLVASVEHYGDSRSNYDPLISVRFWERARDISFALGQLLKEPDFQIDKDRIGFIGYSLGGMTGLFLGGARACNVKEILQRELGRYKEGMDSSLIEQIDLSEAGGSFADLRIKAMVLLMPAVFVFPPESLKMVKIPLALVTSKEDEVLPFPDHSLQIINHLTLAKLKFLGKKARHSIVVNRLKAVRDKFRVEAHKEIGPFVISFFKEQLYCSCSVLDKK